MRLHPHTIAEIALGIALAIGIGFGAQHVMTGVAASVIEAQGLTEETR